MTKVRSFILRQKRVSKTVNVEVLEGNHVQKAVKKIIKKINQGLIKLKTFSPAQEVCKQ